MPDMDGLETAALIRRRQGREHTPIIFVTAFDDELRLARATRWGRSITSCRRSSPEVLRTKVGVFVDLFRMTEQVKRQAEERVALAREQAARAAAEEAARRLRVPGGGRAPSWAGRWTCRRRCAAWPAWPCRSWPTSPPPSTSSRTAAGGTETAGGDAPRRRSAAPRSAAPSTDGKTASPSRRGETPRRTASSDVLWRSRCGGGGASWGRWPWRGGVGRRYAPADVTLAEDVACRAAAALENARLYRDIQEQDHRKTEFLAMLAHELRNPLAPIRNAVQILRQRADDASRQAVGQRRDRPPGAADGPPGGRPARRVAHHPRQGDAARPSRLDVAAVVAAAVETSRPLIDARRHELTVTLPPEPLWVTADPARLAQVLANLLNNAAKYTEEGGRIDLAVERDGGEAVFRVRDTGVGIAAEMLPRVFDLFTQIDRSLDRSEGGLGIGLTLVHRLVEMHGGTVQAFSAGPGRGSEFVVRLPALASAPANAGVSSSHPERDARADAARGGRPSRSRRGRQPGLGPQPRPSAGADGLRSANRLRRARPRWRPPEAFDPDAVVLDIGLPRLNGYEAARRLRARPRRQPLLLDRADRLRPRGKPPAGAGRPASTITS